MDTLEFIEQECTLSEKYEIIEYFDKSNANNIEFLAKQSEDEEEFINDYLLDNIYSYDIPEDVLIIWKAVDEINSFKEAYDAWWNEYYRVYIEKERDKEFKEKIEDLADEEIIFNIPKHLQLYFDDERYVEDLINQEAPVDWLSSDGKEYEFFHNNEVYYVLLLLLLHALLLEDVQKSCVE